MKKKSVFPCILFLSLALTPVFEVAAQSDTQKSKVIEGPFVRNDTVFLYENIYYVDGYREMQAAYIEKDKNSEIVASLLDFSLDPTDSLTYEKDVARLRSIPPHTFKKFVFDDFPTHWVPLKSYRGNYYVHELDAYYSRYFTDSLYVCRWQDGPRPYIIRSFEKKSANHYRAQIIDDISSSDVQESTLDFYMIDRENEVAVVAEKRNNSDYTTYILAVSREKAPNFDFIVWISSELPDDSVLNFDEPDYEKLISQSKH